MNQLFYNIGGGIVHQIRREKTDNNIRSDCSRSLLFRCFSLFLHHLRTLALREKVGKLSSFWDWWAEPLFVSIIVAKYILFPRANNGRSCEKRNFWRSDLLTLSACTIEILSTLTYTEFDWAALLAML